MTVERFPFQHAVTKRALADSDGLVLNVGCKEDPAKLKALDPGRVVNCDETTIDHDTGVTNEIDILFDCTLGWPCGDREACLVVLGDILEHLKPPEIRATLAEARRVGRKLCVTVPQDDDDTTTDEYADQFIRGWKHRTVVSEDFLRAELEEAGWTVTYWKTVDYGLWPKGFFVIAK
jgi:hypothetical protein